ncbi:tripartite tricarboxylate transporter substrate-binding protein, partial [Salmonella enterica]|nr:tripartite tricarboxylate transporter substrate-binding protein [Salmonella enterica]
GFGAISTNALNPFVYPSMPFDPTKDFTGISMLGASSVVLETGPSLKVDSVKDLVAYAKQHAGTAFGTPGTGTSMHLAGVMFDQLTGAGMQHIPYK